MSRAAKLYLATAVPMTRGVNTIGADRVGHHTTAGVAQSGLRDPLTELGLVWLCAHSQKKVSEGHTSLQLRALQTLVALGI